MTKKSGSAEKKPKLKKDGTPKKSSTMPHLQKAGAPSINPNGRPKGSRNKLGDAFLKDFLAVWETDGRDALIDVRIKDPATFVRAAVAILPKEINVNHDVSEVEKLLEQFSIEELDELINGIAALGAKQLGSEAKNKAKVRSKSDSVH